MMIHSAHRIQLPYNRRPNGLHTFVTSSFSSPPESREPVRRGILFMAVAGVLLLIGSILTWLGFNDVFGGKISMTGPLLIALALLLLLMSTRQFMKARKHSRNQNSRLQLGSVGRGTLRAVVLDQNEGVGAVTVIMDSLEVDTNQHYRRHDAPPSYSEAADISTSSWLHSESPQHDEEPPPSYADAILPSENMLTVQLPKYESLTGRRSPVPRYEDIFHMGNLPGCVPSHHGSVCLSHDLLSSANHVSSCHPCVSFSTNHPACSSSQTLPSISCVQHTCNSRCILYQGHLCGNHGQSQQTTCTNTCNHDNQGAISTHFSSVEAETNSTTNHNLSPCLNSSQCQGQCHTQHLTCCINHSPCFNGHAVSCNCTHSSSLSCSPCSPHLTSAGNHFTYPSHMSLTSNQASDTSTNEDLQETPIRISVTEYTGEATNVTTETQIIDTSNYKLDDSDVESNQSESLIRRSSTGNSRLYGTPKQDTEHTF